MDGSNDVAREGTEIRPEPEGETFEGPAPERAGDAGAETEEIRELTPEEIIPLEPQQGGRYNVRWNGKIVKRFSREYFLALDIPAPTWANVPEEKGDPPPDSPTIRVGQAKRVKHTGSYRSPHSQKEAEEAARESAAVILTILNGAVGMAFGEIARMTPEEREAIEEPLGRIMARMSPAANAAISKWTDPILLLTALVTWAGRVYVDIKIEDGDEPYSGPGPDDPLPTLDPSKGNGREVTNDIGAPTEEITSQINQPVQADVDVS